MESDLAFRRNWGLQHLAKRDKNGVEFRVVAFLHLYDLAAKVFVGNK